MKSLLILSCCFACFSGKAQSKNTDSLFNQLLRNKAYRNNSAMVFKYGDKSTNVFPSNRDANGKLLPGVHRLPQDGMICFVPDTKDIAPIPNAFKEKIVVPYVTNKPRIPNPIVIQSFNYRKDAVKPYGK